jgi:hypothetical protein
MMTLSLRISDLVSCLKKLTVIWLVIVPSEGRDKVILF